MTTPPRIRLTHRGKDHYVDGKTTFCKLRIGPDAESPKGGLSCVDCKKEAQRRGAKALREEMDRRARERDRKIAAWRDGVRAEPPQDPAA